MAFLLTRLGAMARRATWSVSLWEVHRGAAESSTAPRAQLIGPSSPPAVPIIGPPPPAAPRHKLPSGDAPPPPASANPSPPPQQQPGGAVQGKVVRPLPGTPSSQLPAAAPMQPAQKNSGSDSPGLHIKYRLVVAMAIIIILLR